MRARKKIHVLQISWSMWYRCIMNAGEIVSKAPWLLLIHQLPAKPAYARVKVWRRLQTLGAVLVKNAVYALPSNEETQEDFAWVAREIVELGGEALVCGAE